MCIRRLIEIEEKAGQSIKFLVMEKMVNDSFVLIVNSPIIKTENYENSN